MTKVPVVGEPTKGSLAWRWRAAGVLVVVLGAGCASTSQSQGAATTPARGAGAGAATAQGQDDPEGEERPGCHRPEMFGPAVVAADVYGAWVGATATKFSSLGVSTKDKPLEECGLRAVLERLVSLKCDDGSNPFAGNLQKAHMSRSGNVGPGGRCMSIIDRYEVPCPEQTYTVFADMYVCPPSMPDT